MILCNTVHDRSNRGSAADSRIRKQNVIHTSYNTQVSPHSLAKPSNQPLLPGEGRLRDIKRLLPLIKLCRESAQVQPLVYRVRLARQDLVRESVCTMHVNRMILHTRRAKFHEFYRLTGDKQPRSTFCVHARYLKPHTALDTSAVRGNVCEDGVSTVRQYFPDHTE